MVTLLAVVVVGGGVAYAASVLPKNSVGPKQLRKDAVRSSKVKDGSLKAIDFAKGELPAGSKGDQGPPGAPGISHAFEKHGSVNYDKLSASLYGSNVIHLPLPAGTYFATADIEVQTVNAVVTTVQCRLSPSGSGFAVSGSQDVRADGSVDNFSLTGLFGIGSGEGLDLLCSKAAAGSGARVDEADLIAAQVTDAAHITE